MSAEHEERVKMLERSMEKAWKRLDNLNEVLTELRVSNRFQSERIVSMENRFLKHMENEEVEMASINKRIESLNSYKYIALGAACVLLALTNPELLKFLEKIVQQ